MSFFNKCDIITLTFVNFQRLEHNVIIFSVQVLRENSFGLMFLLVHSDSRHSEQLGLVDFLQLEAYYFKFGETSSSLQGRKIFIVPIINDRECMVITFQP